MDESKIILKDMIQAICLILSLSVLCDAQEPKASGSSASQSQPTPRVAYTPLEVGSKVEVLGVSEPFLALPVLCSADNMVFVRMATTAGVSDLVGISSDGKNVIRFSTSKISDVTNPTVLKFFVTDSDVYLLMTGAVREGKIVEMRRPDGTVEKLQSATENYFIAHFQHDGSYISSVPLDVPFIPLQFGVFTNGNFLVGGEVARTHAPRIALVGSNGQFNRFVELEGDIRLDVEPQQAQAQGSGENKSTTLPLVGKRFGEGFADAMRLTTIVPYGQNLLLVRKGQKTPVFSIAPGGEVQTVNLEVPDGYSLADLRTSRNAWIGLFTHRISDTQGVEFQSYSLNPQTGNAIERYSYPKFLGFGLACVHDTELVFLTRENDKLMLVKVAPSRANLPKQD
jgi:hypothetical protein